MAARQNANLYQPAVQRVLDALPECERATLEAMIFQLTDGVKGVGAHTALDIIGKTCRFVLAEKRKGKPTNGRA